jgi:hypothetical protein
MFVSVIVFVDIYAFGLTVKEFLDIKDKIKSKKTD